MKRATHFGKINLGGKDLSCAVLEDGTRILTQTALFQAFGRSRRGRALADENSSNLPRFMLSDNIISFINAGLDGRADFEETYYIGKDKKKEMIGYNALILPHICDGFLKARDAGVLTNQQQILADISDITVRSLSKIGIIALIDEATGYQEEREKDALNTLYKLFFSEELIPWQQKFPHLFYKELYRLNGWEYTEENLKKRPSVVGTWTNKLIYEQMPKGVLEELKKKNPKVNKGYRKYKNFQFLSEDIGDPTLSKLISQALTLFGLSDNMAQMWAQFEKLAARRNGQEQLELELPIEPPYKFDEKGYTIEPIEESGLSAFNQNLKKAIDYNAD
jgi:hypothetical protein